jgi:hypothetical protein
MEEFITCGHANWGSLSLLSFSRLRPTFHANRTRPSNSITNFSLTTLPNLAREIRANRTKRRNSITNSPFHYIPILFRGATKCWPCLPPLSRCRDSRLRCCWQPDRDARIRWRFQRTVTTLTPFHESRRRHGYSYRCLFGCVRN